MEEEILEFREISADLHTSTSSTNNPVEKSDWDCVSIVANYACDSFPGKLLKNGASICVF